MSIKLKFIESYLVQTEQEADQLVLDQKDSISYTVVAHTITKKVKKEVEYYVVKITKEYNDEKSIVDSFEVM
jgi:hypothetical protein